MTAGARHSLLRRLLWRIGAVTLALLVASGILSYAVALHYSNEVHDRWLDDSARSLAAQIRFVAQQPALELPDVALEMFVFDAQDEIYYEVTDRRGRRIAGNFGFTDLPAPDADGRTRVFDTAQHGKRLRAVVLDVRAPANDQTIRVVVAETLNKRTRLARDILAATVPVQLLLIVVGGAAVWLALRGGVRVLDTVAAAIRARDPDDTHALKLTAEAPTEIEPLLAALDDLIRRVNDARASQQRFVANAAHQLRTPVATLQIQVERAMRERDPAERDQALRQVNAAVARLGRLLHQILTLAKLAPDVAGRALPVSVDLCAVARATVERHVDAALARSVDLGLAVPAQPVLAIADPLLVEELLANLIDNALRHGRAGGRVTVGVSADPATLYVEDDGPGIPAAERERVWDRFYRAPGTTGPGSGLGLAIVREIAELHGAVPSIEAVAGGGTRVVVRMERAGATQGAMAPAIPA